MNFICKRNLGYLKEFRKRQSSCQLPWLMINTGFDCELWKVKSVVISPALAVQCSMRERVLTWLFQIYFLLRWNCAKLQIYYSVWKALFWAGVSFIASQLRVSQLCPERNSCVEQEPAEEVAQDLAALFGWLIRPFSLAGCESPIHGNTCMWPL